MHTIKAILLAGFFGIVVVMGSSFFAQIICVVIIGFGFVEDVEEYVITTLLILRCFIYFCILYGPWNKVRLIRSREGREQGFLLKSCSLGGVLIALWNIPLKESMHILYLITGGLVYQYIAVTWKERQKE